MKAARVTVTELVRKMEGGEPVVFLDSRHPDEWGKAATKLPGAIRVAPGEVELRLAAIPRDCAVVAYCTCRGETASARVALALKEHRFEDVSALEGGFHAWVKAWLPLVPKDGDEVGSLELIRITDPVGAYKYNSAEDRQQPR